MGLGANLGCVTQTLCAAIDQLGLALGALRVASLYRSQAISPLPQADFFNTVVSGTTALPPTALLAIAKRLELVAGRRLAQRWAPRALDIDLLVHGDLVRDAPELTLPHPRLRQRRFVLAPLAQLHPDWRLPPDGRTVADLLRSVGQDGQVEQLDWPSST